jgi:hypothetical protein
VGETVCVWKLSLTVQVQPHYELHPRVNPILRLCEAIMVVKAHVIDLNIVLMHESISGNLREDNSR